MYKKALKLFPVLLSHLPVETAKKAVDAALDVIEDSVKESKTKLDDIIIIPVVKIIRSAANISDND